MSDGQGGAVADAIAGAAGGGATGGNGGQQQDQGQQQQQQDTPWQQKFLPPDLAADETLTRYGSVGDMAKGLLETRRWASGRVAVPGAADATAFEEFAGKVRPADAKDYTILGPDGKESPVGEAFRGVFHEVGLHPIQAQRLTEKWNQYQADEISRLTQAGRDQITAIEMELGPQAYNQRAAAVEQMFTKAGFDFADVATGLEQSMGAGATMKFLFAMAEKTGELAKVDGATVEMRMGAMTADAAQQELDRMSRDPEMGKKLNDVSSPEYSRRKQLLAVVAKGGGKSRPAD